MPEQTTIQGVTAEVQKDDIPDHSRDGKAYANVVEWIEEHHDAKAWTIDDVESVIIHCVPSGGHTDAERTIQVANRLLCGGYFRPTEHTTIRVTLAAKENADKEKHPNETWNEFIQRLSDEPPEIVEFAESPEIDYTELANQVGEEVERRLR